LALCVHEVLLIVGAATYKSLKWVHELQTEKAAKIVNKRLDDWRERYQDQLGKPRDPLVLFFYFIHLIAGGLPSNVATAL